MFIWGQVHTDTPFYFPNREALLDLYADIVDTPGVEQHVLSHATIAPSVVDPLLDREALGAAARQEPDSAAAAQHASREAGARRRSSASRPDRFAWPSRSCRAKACPFRSTTGRASCVQGLKVLNENNWFPAMTLIVGSPGETDDDVQGNARSDLRNRAARPVRVLHPVDLHAAARHADGERKGVTETKQLTPLQWQLMMKCWKMNLRPGQSVVGADGVARRRGRPLGRKAAQAERAELHLAAADVRERGSRVADDADGQALRRRGRCAIKSRKELLATIKPHHRQYLRADAGDLPDQSASHYPPAASPIIKLTHRHAAAPQT